MNPTMKTLLGDWEEVYGVTTITHDTWTEDLPLFHEDTIYYQTFGGAPAQGGYFVKGDSVWRVSRSVFQPWRVEKLKNKVFEFEPENYEAMRTARCRLVEVYSLLETRKIVDEHVLWGNTIEMVKALRDGLTIKQGLPGYKDLCLGIILEHLCVLDKHLDLLPPDSCGRYKKVLHDLKADLDRKEAGEDSDESEDESDQEDEVETREVVCCGRTVMKSKTILTSDNTLMCKKCWT